MRTQIVYCLVETAWGWCAVASRGKGVWRSCLPCPTPEAALAALNLHDSTPFFRGTSPILVASNEEQELADAAHFVVAYFRGEPISGRLAVDLSDATDFSRTVLMQCQSIGWGRVCTYGELARQVGHPGAARAVGQVMAHNPLPPIVPCHRVLGTGGTLTGFGPGISVKAKMLELEGWEVLAGRVAKRKSNGLVPALP